MERSPVIGRAIVLAALLSGVARGQQRIEVSPAGAVRSIGAAIAAARPGATIVVRAGAYREPTIVVDRSVTIVGEPGSIIDGEGKRELVTIRANDVTVRGLTLRNVGTSFVEDRAAVRAVGVTGCVIADNRVEDGFFGIYLSNASDCRIERNVLLAHARTEVAAGNGIHLWSSRRISITGNRISGHRDGIYFEFVHDSRIEDNTSESNLRYGMHFMYSDDCAYVRNVFRHNGSGVAVMYTKRVLMSGNRFEDNWGAASYGLLLKEIGDPRLVGNVFSGNTTGLLADGTTRLIAEHNEFAGNGWAVRLDANSQDARFTANNFRDNTFDVSTNGASQSSVFAGNYWAAYRGYDLDRDGVGDVPHRPVRLFSMIVEQNQPALLLLRSPFVDLLDAAERALPVLTPEALADRTPAMRRIP